MLINARFVSYNDRAPPLSSTLCLPDVMHVTLSPRDLSHSTFQSSDPIGQYIIHDYSYAYVALP